MIYQDKETDLRMLKELADNTLESYNELNQQWNLKPDKELLKLEYLKVLLSIHNTKLRTISMRSGP